MFSYNQLHFDDEPISWKDSKYLSLKEEDASEIFANPIWDGILEGAAQGWGQREMK